MSELAKVKQYQKLLVRLAAMQEFGGDKNVMNTIRQQLAEMWKNLSTEHQDLVDQLSEDLYLFRIPDPDDTEDPKIKIMSLEKDIREWDASFDIYHRATRGLHTLYPHPNPMTLRDLGEMIGMAVEEITKARAGEV